jgi:phosphatidylserine/phosphatidylglycerophosphate/cardiolipin synthase-like enzyme
MRTRKKSGALSVHAISGTHCVLLGMNIEQVQCKGLLGFAIHREDPKENESYWLSGMRTFEASYPNPPIGSLSSTREQPVQDFLWSDFTAKPGRKYTYSITPVYGKPKKLVYRDALSIDVETEAEASGKHSIYFNRGVIGSQAYSRKFDASPEKLASPKREQAYKWLSRGLEEAILGFIANAKDESFGLRAAIYEFEHEPVIAAFAQAQKKSKDVQIIFDARIKTTKNGVPDPKAVARVTKVKSAIINAGIKGICIERTADPANISHNNFIILLKDDKPIAVWTGSTNFTKSGIFGHANVGHLVKDEKVAQKYLDYWKELKSDPVNDVLKPKVEAISPTSSGLPAQMGITPIFSPRKGLAQLNWYAGALDSSKQMNCFTAAFGINDLFLNDYSEDRDYLRYIFLEKWGVNKETAAKAQTALAVDKDVQVAVGSYLTGAYPFDWATEILNTLSKNIRFVHTKFLLIDPLSDHPTVISGSANFSDNSTSGNDENMLIIRGDTRVADIYLGEFMRLWRHHNFRYIIETVDTQSGTVKPNYLDPTDSWTNGFFDKSKTKLKRRLLFS